MIGRAVRILAAVLAATGPLLLASPGPAHAAVPAAAVTVVAGPVAAPVAGPVTQTSTLCTLDEWRNPLRIPDCLRREKANVTDQVDCRSAPTPDTPMSGGGWLTTRPDEDLQPGVKGLYTQYGVAGYQLSFYDVGIPPACTVTNAVANFGGFNMNAAASFGFSAASAVVAGTNWLRGVAYNPQRSWGWADPFVVTITDALFQHVFGVFGIVVFAGIGLWLLWHARSGDASRALNIIGWTLLVLCTVTAIGHYSIHVVHALDHGTTATMSTFDSHVGAPPADVPADKCVYPGPGCKDHRTPATRSGDVLVRSVLYNNWLRAELGDADSPVAQKYGMALYTANTLSWAEAASVRADPKQWQVIAAQKAQQWQDTAALIRAEDPVAYRNLQGLNPSNRVWSSFFAVLGAVMSCWFDVLTSLIIYFGYAVFRIAIMLAPLVGTWGLFLHASNGFRRLANTVVASAFNVVTFSVVAAIYLRAAAIVTSVPELGFGQFLFLGALGLGGLLTLNPLRKIGASFGFVKVPSTGAARRTAAGVAAQLGVANLDPGADGPAAPLIRPETVAAAQQAVKDLGVKTAMSAATGVVGPAGVSAATVVAGLLRTAANRTAARPETTAGSKT